MPDKPMKISKFRCTCGGVEYAPIRAPITSAVCYCVERDRKLSGQFLIPCSELLWFGKSDSSRASLVSQV